MTEKRFTIKPQDDLFGVVDNYSADKICVINGIRTEIEAEWLCKDMNALNDENEQLKNKLKFFNELNKPYGDIIKENEQLKQREETLLCEIEDFQELLAKNDNVCHKRVIDLIDDRIFNFSNLKTELLLNSDDDYRLEKLSFAIQNLRELKKELEE